MHYFSMRRGRQAKCSRLVAPPLLAVALWSTASHAQEAAGTGVRITPSFSLQEMVTDNRGLSSSNRQADSITTISPGIRIDSPSGRVRGSLAYSLNALVYASDSHSDTLQNSLQANLTAEAIENHGFVNATASVSQQTISAFGTQSGGTGLVNGNSTEVSTLSVTPSWRSRIGDLADFTAALNWSGTHSASTNLGNSTTRGGNVGLQGRSGLFGWGLSASRQVNAFTAGLTTTNDQGTATLSFFPDPEVQLSVNAGREAQDVLTGTREWTSISGWSIGWQPTDRTNIALQGGRTYYGHSHSFTFTHRMARSVWSYSDIRGVAGTPSGRGSFIPLTLYDLFFAICLQGGGEAAACDQSVRTGLAQQGLNPNTVIGGSFLAPGLTQQRSQTLSVSVSGLLTTITLSAFRTATSPLNQAAIRGDLATVSLVRQQGFTLGVSQRLTPTDSVNASATVLRTLDTGPQPGTEQRLVSLTWLDNLGPRTDVSLTVRHTQFDSSTSPYQESAIIGTLSLRF